MVTRGAVQYSLFRLQKYSRMQAHDLCGTKEEPNAGYVPQNGHGPCTCKTASKSERWGHVSVQPLWCRVVTITNEGEAPSTYLSVEWCPFTPTIPSGLTSVQDGNLSAYKSYTVLVGCSLTKESLNLSSNTWHPKSEREDIQRTTKAQFTFKATYQGSRVGFRCRQSDTPIGAVCPDGTQECYRRFQLHFLSTEEATAFLQRIQVGGLADAARMSLCTSRRADKLVIEIKTRTALCE